ncbi:RuBisCO large subunit C-terminal-like domain-containing protein [Georgenia sp. Z1491]|uniref:RuBisCO large subunit C-terminal-like domain-containing protein n=1 Tax=Georgenia sp. Z1491 TaxID=3416707 RepID=UPI003CF3935F
MSDVGASYVLWIDAGTDPYEVVRRFAVGQSTGTWLPVPGLTDELRAAHEARVLDLQPVPAADLVDNGSAGSWYLATIAVPSVNVGDSIPQLLTTVIGNDASTSVQAKLVGLDLPPDLLARFAGPRHGIDGLRERVGIHDRPLLLNMVKPCTGLTPEAGAEIVHRTALGGVDLIKDDELLGNTEFSPVVDRVRAYTAAIDRAADETGRRALYFVNVTDRPDRMLDTARRAVDAGAEGVMVAYANAGYGSMQALAEAVEVPVLGHFAGSAPYYENPTTGMSSDLANGLLPRLAGADLSLVNTPYGGYPISPVAYRRTAAELTSDRPGLRRTAPIIGGGVHPGTVRRYVDEVGADVVLGVGGAIQGHPGGAAAGVRAMHAAIEAAVAGLDVHEAAAEDDDLRVAIERWGTLEP